MIKNLTITNFRNHSISRITTNGHRNIIITGDNGAGKTAILESVSMLAGERGLRGADMQEIAQFGKNNGFSIHAELYDDSDVSVYFCNNDSNRHAKFDNENVPLSNLAKHLRIVWLTPKEDRIFLESASERRSFFDRLTGSFDSAHLGRTNKLSKLLSERAFALKNNADNNWLDALDTQISATAVAISAARIQYAGELNYFLTDSAVSVNGLIESRIIQTNAADTERYYLNYLRENRFLVGDKMVLDGPHKSDFGVFNNTLKLPANLTSTGQQKNILINLILAHAKLIFTKTGKTPIILLDEAAAHLDDATRQKIFFELGNANAQVWATGLDYNVFKNIPDATFVTCVNGEINNII